MEAFDLEVRGEMSRDVIGGRSIERRKPKDAPECNHEVLGT